MNTEKNTPALRFEKVNYSRLVVSAIIGYFLDGLLTWASEVALGHIFLLKKALLFYYLTDLASQSLYTIAAGYLCRFVAKSSRPGSIVILIGIGLVIGSISMISAWNAEPHWYGISLNCVFPLCAWFGWRLNNP